MKFKAILIDDDEYRAYEYIEELTKISFEVKFFSSIKNIFNEIKNENIDVIMN